MFRKLLKSILIFLSKWAISKHDMELVVVTGFSGTQIVKEGIYDILKSNYQVRRSVNPITWDMSIPLTVLGHKDKKRNALEWLLLIINVFGYLAVGAKNKHTLVIDVNCKFEETAKFWSNFIKPDYLVITNYARESVIIDELLQNLKDNTHIICPKDFEGSLRSKVKKHINLTTFAKNDADITYQIGQEINYKGSKIAVSGMIPVFLYPMLSSIIGTCVAHGMKLEDVVGEMLKFDMREILTKRIKANFERA